jgi:serine/threonine protein phosphatase 1
MHNQNRKKLFVLSDLHGHYTLAKEELDRAGFDPQNPNHLFVHCGDLFDRGKENRLVYEFVTSLPHKVLIRGNHDEHLVEILQRGYVTERDYDNGLQPTLEEFFGKDNVSPDGKLNLLNHADTVRDLCTLVAGMSDYFETENYVFTHGWLPLAPGATPPRLAENWREADRDAWHEARWLKWLEIFRSPARLPDKTIVCGHRPTRMAADVDPTRSPTDSTIYRSEGMIAIDAGSIRSGRVNLLVIEDHIL